MTDFTLSNPIGSEVDDEDVRTTPRWLFDAFNDKLHFALDAAASADNTLCARFIDAARDALRLDWTVESRDGAVWCNPPFSRLGEFATKASAFGALVPVAFLIPANRWEQPWVHRTVLATSSFVVMPEGRVAYGGSGGSPEWPSAVVVWLPWLRKRRHLISLAEWVGLTRADTGL